MWFIVYKDEENRASLSFPCVTEQTVIGVSEELKTVGYCCSDPFFVENKNVVGYLAQLKAS